MAGIGFRLQKLLAEDSLTAGFKAYAYSALIAAGPYLLTVIVVCLVHWVSLTNLSLSEQTYLQNMITYTFAFSLVAIGACYLVVTRYVADEYYREHTSNFTAVFLLSFTLNALLWGPPALAYFCALSISWVAKLDALVLFLATIGIWLALVFLSAARQYQRILIAFASGAIVSLAAAFCLGRLKGFDGYLTGYACGQAVTFVCLAGSIMREFGYREARDYYWLHYFARYPLLAGIGFCYNIGIWVDKFLFWASPEGRSIDFYFRYCPIYDAPMFFSYLSVIPALAYFLFRMETGFFTVYQAYYQSIESQAGLPALERRRVEIVDNLAYSLKRLALGQGLVSGLVLLQVPRITQWAHMDPIQMSILRTGIFASCLQVGFLIALNLLLYFDLQKEALACSFLFLASNAGLTYISLHYGLPVYGFGYALACLLSLGVALCVLNARLEFLHYWMFMKQPIPRLIPAVESDD